MACDARDLHLRPSAGEVLHVLALPGHQSVRQDLDWAPLHADVIHRLPAAARVAVSPVGHFIEGLLRGLRHLRTAPDFHDPSWCRPECFVFRAP